MKGAPTPLVTMNRCKTRCRVSRVTDVRELHTSGRVNNNKQPDLRRLNRRFQTFFFLITY